MKSCPSHPPSQGNKHSPSRSLFFLENLSVCYRRPPPPNAHFPPKKILFPDPQHHLFPLLGLRVDSPVLRFPLSYRSPSPQVVIRVPSAPAFLHRFPLDPFDLPRQVFFLFVCTCDFLHFSPPPVTPISLETSRSASFPLSTRALVCRIRLLVVKDLLPFSSLATFPSLPLPFDRIKRIFFPQNSFRQEWSFLFFPDRSLAIILLPVPANHGPRALCSSRKPRVFFLPGFFSR